MVDINPYTKNIITIRLDADLLKEFSGYDKSNPETYFQTHPRAKKAPFEALWGKSRDGLAPSWNTFLDCPSRQIQASWKKHYGDYASYCFKKQGIKHHYLDKYLVLVVQYKPRATKSDNDNTMVKSVLDAMVKDEIVVEDNFTNMLYYSSISVVDRQDPRTEILVYPVTDEFTYDIAMLQLMNDAIELIGKYNESL